MQGLEDTANWIANNVFGQVPILIGLITLAGLLVQRRPVEAVVSGALRAMIGIVILLVGTDLLSGGLAGLQTIISSAAGLDPPASSNTMDAFLVTHGNTVALVITIGFVLHLLLVRLFPEAGFLYLSGHLMFWTSLVITATLVAVFGDRSQATLVICGSVIIACYWTLQPLWMRPLMRKVGAGDYGLASTASVTALLTGWLARPFGDPARHDTERLRPPRRLAFLTDVNVAGALVVGGTLLVAMAFADKGVLAEQARSYNDTIDPWVWGVITALRFAGDRKSVV